jgi:GNAT superfamily N-acetyltransferase
MSSRTSRGQGVGRALIEADETHARATGYHEIAGDVDLGNADGIAAPLALGYTQVERAMCFHRSLRDATIRWSRHVLDASARPTLGRGPARARGNRAERR